MVDFYRYIKVLLGYICCEDEREDRVSVGFGDFCCGDVLYFNNSV